MQAAIIDGRPMWVPARVPVAFTALLLANPNRVRVTADTGQVAVFTVGSKTVAVSGLQPRTFTEQKRVGPATKDDFLRTRGSRWGLSPYYGSWSSPVGGLDTDWTVDGATAKVHVDTTNVSRYSSLRDGDLVDYRIRAVVSLDSLPVGANNSLSLTGNYADTSNHYRYRWTVNPDATVQLAMDRVSGGSSTLIAPSLGVGGGYTPGQMWEINAEHVGGVPQCMAWPYGGTPPAAWQRSFTDPAPLGPGRVGIRAFATTGATNSPTFSVHEFEITAGRWANPPTVTHDTWVRLLPAPFTAWTPEVEAWLRAALVDTTPDVLARAASFVTGAAVVVDGSYGVGRGQVMGPADYGPSAADGGRIEGADWNDYIRTTGHYPHLAVPSDDINELAQVGCLDCSGYVRMVYGYWGGLPMSLADPADLNGLNLPRRSVHIGPSGPGVLVASSADTVPPPLDAIQVGDVVSFNADVADDVAGDESGDVEQTDDHVGIYLGRDAGGNWLFISARKTANAPTFGAVGGPSYLNGAGLWAQSLRHIRRF